MRPFTLILAGFALLLFGAAAGLVWKLRRPADASAAPEEAAPVVAERPREERPPSQERSKATLERLRPRSVPRFDTQAIDPWAPRPGETIEQAQLRKDASQDGFLYREEGSDKIFVVKHGTRFFIPSTGEFAALGYKPEQVRTVKPGALPFLRDQPPNGVLLRERGTYKVYYFEGGKRRWISSPDAFQRAGFEVAAIRDVPRGGLQTFNEGDHIN